MTEQMFRRAQVISVLAMMVLIALPFVLYHLRSEYQGLVPMRTNDDGAYETRIQAAALGRFTEVRNGITTGDPPARGAPPALLELVAGSLFSFTGLRGPEIAILFMVLIAPLTIPLLTSLLRSLAVSPGLALGMSLAYTFVFLSPLQRPVNMSLSLPLTLAAILLLARAWSQPRPFRMILAGVLLGLLPSVFFWSWTFAWAAGALLFLLELLFGRTSREHTSRVRALLLMALITILVSLPALIDLTATAMTHPFFAETGLRSQIVHSRFVESVPRSLLLTLLTLSSFLLILRMSPSEHRERGIFALALVGAIFLAMHQNIVHGLIFTFASHYYPFVCLAAVTMAAWALAHAPRSILRHGVVGITAVFLLAGAGDYRVAWSLPLGDAKHLHMQHLAPALKILRDGNREVVLSDPLSAQMVTAWTEDSVVFTPYVRHLLVSDREYAERYCLSTLPDPAGPDYHWLASEAVQRLRAFLPDREKQFRETCVPFLDNPAAALVQYDVTTLLWNERLHPEWVIDVRFFEKTAQGDGWSLWRFMPSNG